MKQRIKCWICSHVQCSIFNVHRSLLIAQYRCVQQTNKRTNITKVSNEWFCLFFFQLLQQLLLSIFVALHLCILSSILFSISIHPFHFRRISAFDNGCILHKRYNSITDIQTTPPCHCELFMKNIFWCLPSLIFNMSRKRNRSATIRQMSNCVLAALWTEYRQYQITTLLLATKKKKKKKEWRSETPLNAIDSRGVINLTVYFKTMENSSKMSDDNSQSQKSQHKIFEKTNRIENQALNKTFHSIPLYGRHLSNKWWF